MNWKPSVGFALIFLLFIWAMNNSMPKAPAPTPNAAADTVAAESKAPDTVRGAPLLGPVTTTPTITAPQAVLPPVVQENPAQDTTAPVPFVRLVERRVITVETDRFSASIDNQGAMLVSLVPKALADTAGMYPELLQFPEQGALGIQLDNADFSTELFSVDTTLASHIRIKDSLTLSFLWEDQFGRQVVRSYTFRESSHYIGHQTVVKNFRPNLYTIHWRGGMRETEPFLEAKTFGPAGYFFSEVVLNNGFNVQRETPTERTWYNKDQGKARWAGLRRKYVAAVINWDGESEASIGAEPIKLTNPHDMGTYSLQISDYMPRNDTISFRFVVLPLVHRELKALGQSYEKILFSGWEWIGADKWFVALSGFILSLLNIFYGIIPNYGVAIILLTLLVKFVTMPLTIKQLKSTREMQRHKPELDAIRVRNRANPRKAQEEMMEYYRKVGINPLAPLGGCLTMILQMPIFIALFVVLGRAVELRFAPFIGWITDLSKPDVIYSGISIPYIMPLGLSVLPFLMAYTTYMQTKQTITDPNQKMLVYIMPAMMLFFAGLMPSGLVVYWVVSNIFSIVQYWLMNRNLPPIEKPASMKATPFKVVKGNNPRK